MIPELAKSCKEENILFMSTPFSVQDAISIDPYTTIHKISSFEINHIKLIEFLAKTRKPILISTGASTYEEIDFCVDLIKKCGNNTFVLLQCTSKYPCPIEFLNLSVIPKMRLRYGVPIGFSDHSIEHVIDSGLTITSIVYPINYDSNLSLEYNIQKIRDDITPLFSIITDKTFKILEKTNSKLSKS